MGRHAINSIFALRIDVEYIYIPYLYVKNLWESKKECTYISIISINRHELKSKKKHEFLH